MACIHCTRRQQQCSFYTGMQEHAGSTAATIGVPPAASWPDHLLARLSPAQKLDLVENYFALIHDRPHSLFHRPTFMADLRSNRISKSLILGVYALASYLSTDESIRRLGLEMAEASRGLLLADIGNPALAHIQTAILLATVYAAECEPRTDAMFFAIATRMAQILRLHDRDERADAVTQQTRGRVWWSLVMADYWGSAGLMIQRQLQTQPSNVPLPGPEDEFHAASPHQQDLDGPTPGLWAHMINLVRIFGFIQDLHQELAVERLSHEELDSKVEGVARQLDAWADSLPTEVVLNDQNVQAHISRGLGGPFMALHLGFHHYFTLLFFHALDSHGHHTANQIKFTRRCRGHALSFSRLLQTSRNTPGCEASYATMGHMTVVSSSVLLHMLLFGDDNDLFEAKNSLMGNFSTLMELEKSWPSLGVSVWYTYIIIVQIH